MLLKEVGFLVGVTKSGALTTVPLYKDLIGNKDYLETEELNQDIVFSDLYIGDYRAYTVDFTEIEKYLFHNDIEIGLLQSDHYRTMGDVVKVKDSAIRTVGCCKPATKEVSFDDYSLDLSHVEAVGDVYLHTLKVTQTKFDFIVSNGTFSGTFTRDNVVGMKFDGAQSATCDPSVYLIAATDYFIVVNGIVDNGSDAVLNIKENGVIIETIELFGKGNYSAGMFSSVSGANMEYEIVNTVGSISMENLIFAVDYQKNLGIEKVYDKGQFKENIAKDAGVEVPILNVDRFNPNLGLVV